MLSNMVLYEPNPEDLCASRNIVIVTGTLLPEYNNVCRYLLPRVREEPPGETSQYGRRRNLLTTRNGMQLFVAKVVMRFSKKPTPIPNWSIITITFCVRGLVRFYSGEPIAILKNKSSTMSARAASGLESK